MLRIGSVGTSRIMRTAHEAIRLTDGMECAVVYSRDFARAKEFADTQGVKESCSDYAALLKRDDIDIIYIASPNKCHFSQTLQALKSRKHVIVEKPAVTDVSKARLLFESARSNGVYCFEAITTLFMPNYKACKAFLQKLGTIKSARFCYGRRSSRYDDYLSGKNPNIFNPDMLGGALNDMGVYCVHAAADLFGVPERVEYKAEFGENGVDLFGRLTLHYRGFECEITASKSTDLKCGCRVDGENGWFEQNGELNDFSNCTGVLYGAPAALCRPQSENRMIYEFSFFRDAILKHDDIFFEKLSRQTEAAADILEKAHASCVSDRR